jgi:integrase
MTEYVFRPKRTGHERARLYSGRYTLNRGEKPRTVALGTPDKLVAVKRLRDVIVQAQRLAEGLISPPSEREAAALPLATLATEYIADLTARGRSVKHIVATEFRLRAVLTGTGWLRLSDIRADEFVKWRGTLKRAAKTVREYHAAANMFLNWLLRLDRISRNPLAKVPQVETRGKQVRATRALTPAELAGLFEAVPADRRRAYQFLTFTGCRLGEAKTLVWGDVRLDDAPPHILLREGATKDRTARAIPLHPRLVEVIRAMRPEGVFADVKVFKTFPGPMTLERDLVRAGIVKHDQLGRTMAFHSFRKTFQTMGVRAGVNQRAAQALLGHSDANHTAKIYTDMPETAFAEEVAKIPWVEDATAERTQTSAASAINDRFRLFCANIVEMAKDGVFEAITKENSADLAGSKWCGQRESNEYRGAGADVDLIEVKAAVNFAATAIHSLIESGKGRK